MDAYIGKMLDGRYEILEVIGTGGMAIVYKAMDHRLNRQVAVKVLKNDLAQNADFRRRFHDEAQAVAMLSHPNIVSVYDVSHDGDAEYIVMELIDGITLKQYMERRGQLNWREALHFITQIMKGLGHAHSRGIIHRDIKPHNIMILRDGSVKVADFGIACLVASAENTLTQEALGSVHYISPEQAKGGHTDARSDIYSAGVVLYEMLTNRLPFEGDSAVSIAIQHISSVPLSPREINPDIPEALELITMKAMAPDMDKRYPSAEAMLHDLDEFRKNPSINFDYVLSDFAVEETSEPTQHLSAADMSEVRHYHTAKSHGRDSRREEYDDRRRDYAEHRKDYDDYDDYDERPVRRGRKNSSRKGVMIGAVIAAVAVIAILFAVIFSGFAGGGQEEYEVPSLLGKTVEEVLADENFTSRFTLETSGTQFSDEYAQGEIMDQSPEGGRTKKGPKGELHVITVVVSQGPQTDEMPDLLNYNRTSAEGLLKNMDLDLNIVIEEEFSDEIEADHVISTDPVKDTLLKKGDTVTLVMSKGKEIKTVTIINYVGMSLDEARGQLGGLVYGGSTEVEDESAPGTILDQSLSVGDEVEEGTEITFIVSKGIPDQPTEPGSITKTFDLPEGEGTVDVQILVGDQVQFDSTVDKSLGSVTCTLTGTGTQQVYVKFDGIVKYTETVTFS